MLSQIIGRTIAQRSGLNDHAQGVGFNAGLRASLRAQETHVLRQVALADSEATARRMLASEWRASYQAWAEACEVGDVLDPTGAMQAAAHARLVVWADEAFDDLPLWSAGLQREAVPEQAPLWYGPVDAVGFAVKALAGRGAQLAVDQDQQIVTVSRGPRVVAVLGAVEVPPPPLPPLAMLPAPSPWGWALSWGVGFVGVFAALVLATQLHQRLALAVLLGPLALVQLARWGLRRARRTPWRIATMATEVAPPPISVEQAVARARAAGLTVTTRGTQLTIDGAVTMAIVPGQPLALLALPFRYRDLTPAIHFAASLTDLAGSLTITTGATKLVVTGGDAIEHWRRDRAALRALATDVERGYRRAAAGV